MKMRILHIIWQGGVGGVERLILDTTRNTDFNKYEITLAIIGRGGIITDLIDRQHVRVYEFGFSYFCDPIFFTRIFLFLKRNRYDIIHVHARTLLVSAALTITGTQPIRIYHEHGQLLRYPRRTCLFHRLFKRYYDAFIVANDEMKKQLNKRTGIPNANIYVVNYPVDSDLFSPRGSLKSDLSRCPIIGILGRLAPEKDMSLFIKTAQLIVEGSKDSKFVIVGDGPLRSELEKEIDSLGLKENVEIAGATDKAQAFLNNIDIFLFTSLVEAYGIVLLESLACAVPIVAAMPLTGGARTLINTLPGIIKIEDRDPRNIAAAVLALMNDHDRRKSLGMAGREYVIRNYSIKNWINFLDLLYLKIQQSMTN